MSHNLKQENNLLKIKLLKTEGLVSLWDFSVENGTSKVSDGKEKVELKDDGGNPVEIVQDGVLSSQSIKLDGTNYLSIPYKETGLLDIRSNEVTVIAWIKWTGEQIGFIGGMWNEHQGGGRRQYGLFASLPHYNGKDQVCGHISKTGKPTFPFPYSIDYSAGKQKIPYNKWCCAAFTYDGKYIRSYLNGQFEEREKELIDNTKGFKGYPKGLQQVKNPYFFPDGMGNNESDFTVGAVLLHSGMGNFFKGQIGGLAVFDRSLSTQEMKVLAVMPEMNK